MSFESAPEVQLSSLIGEEAQRARRPLIVLSAVALAVGTGLIELQAASAAGLSVKLSDHALPLIFGVSTLYLLCSFISYSFVDWQRYKARVVSIKISVAYATHDALMRKFEQSERERTLREQAEAMTKEKRDQVEQRLYEAFEEKERLSGLREELREAGEQGSRFTWYAHEHRILQGNDAVLERHIRSLKEELQKIKKYVTSDFTEHTQRYIQQAEEAAIALRDLESSSAIAAGVTIRVVFDYGLPILFGVCALVSLIIAR